MGDFINKEETYSTGQLSHLFGLNFSVKFLMGIGIEPAAHLSGGLAVYWWKRDFQKIRVRLAEHILHCEETTDA